MKKAVLIYVGVILSIFTAYSQDVKDTLEVKDTLSSNRSLNVEYEVVDSVVYIPSAVMDTTLVGKDIFKIMPSKDNGDVVDVAIHQSKLIRNAMKMYRENNYKNIHTPLKGYRVRIFFDNSKSARFDSEKIIDEFREQYRGVKVYRSYEAPYFAVTVGDCRTKTEAVILHSKVKSEYPAAIVVNHDISFPTLDKSKSYVVDTLRLFKPIAK